MNQMRLAVLCTVLLTSIGIGFSVASSSFKGQIALHTLDSKRGLRIPATTRDAEAFSDLANSVRTTVFTDPELVIRKPSDFIGLSRRPTDPMSASEIVFADFLVKNSEGQLSWACTEFDRIEMEFLAVGMASSGHVPVLRIKTSCESSARPGDTEPIRLPFQDITGRPAEDGEIRLAQYPDQLIQAEHIYGQWPTKWALKTVRLFKSEVATSNDSVEIQHPNEDILFDLNLSRNQPSIY